MNLTQIMLVYAADMFPLSYVGCFNIFCMHVNQTAKTKVQFLLAKIICENKFMLLSFLWLHTLCI